MLHIANTIQLSDRSYGWHCRCGQNEDGFADLAFARKAGDLHLSVANNKKVSEPCQWCGRAIYLTGETWFAVKGKERKYDPLLCDANFVSASHEPSVER